jgi:two-component system NtrC family sensor kinase
MKVFLLRQSFDEHAEQSLRLLQDVSRAVNSSLILEDIFEALTDVLDQYIPFDHAAIVILDESQNSIKTLVQMTGDGVVEITSDSHYFSGYDPVVNKMLANPTPKRYESGEAALDLAKSVVMADVEIHGEDQVWCGLVVPLINKGMVIGLIAMIRNANELFQPLEESQLVQVCEQLAVAVENAKFYWQTQTQASREFLINQIIKSIRQSLDVETILKTAVGELGRVLGVSRCQIHYFQAAPPIPSVYTYRMPGVAPLINAPEGFEQELFRLRQQPDQAFNPFILNDVRDCPERFVSPAFFAENQIKSLAVFPILIRQELVGAMTLQQCDVYRSWISEDMSLLEAIGEHLGIALNQAQLFRELDQKNQDLETALFELQQAQVHLIQSEKMAVLGQFVAGIAHEVNTPLGTMTSNNAMIESCVKKVQANPTDAPVKLYDTMFELLSLNKLASERIQEIVKNLRNFARLDESELKYADLHEGIDSTLLVMRSSLAPHVKIIKDYAVNLPQVQCYPGLLNQVVMNLVVNATHAMGDMPTGSLTIQTCYRAETETVQIVLSDTGTGISPEHLTRIFDPGFTTKRRGVGTGLGLALCYKIMEKHKGSISVKSVLGEGTTFTVEIPVRQGKI